MVEEEEWAWLQADEEVLFYKLTKENAEDKEHTYIGIRKDCIKYEVIGIGVCMSSTRKFWERKTGLGW